VCAWPAQDAGLAPGRPAPQAGAGTPAPAEAAPARAAGAPVAERTAVRVVVDVGKSELELLRTAGGAAGEPAPLARFAVGSLWVAFRYASEFPPPVTPRRADRDVHSAAWRRL
jgi:hypothetical protein